MEIKIAQIEHTKKILDFLRKNLDVDVASLYPVEFSCPFGLKSSIKKGNVVAVMENNNIIAVLRYYPRKRDNIVSIYWFGIDENHKKDNLLIKMLEFTNYKIFEFICPRNIEFNNYYKKIGATILKQDEKYNYWILEFN